MTAVVGTHDASLRALFDTVIPPDEAPGGWEGGVGTLLTEHHLTFMAWSIPKLRTAIALLEQIAGRPFDKLSPSERTTTFEEAYLAELESPWQGVDSVMAAVNESSRAALGPIAAVIVVAYEGYYGGTAEPTGWAVTGYSALPVGTEPIEPPIEHGIALADVAGAYDVVIVGAGAGGGVAAAEFAQGGRRVLLLERSAPIGNRALRGNHLQDLRLSRYKPLAGAGQDSSRVIEYDDGSSELIPGDTNAADYGLVAMSLGGGTRFWQGMSWRFYPEDFRMASVYGVPPDSTLADWPFGYEEFAPYYDEVEWGLGVAGNAAGPLGQRTPRTRSLPMPALPGDRARETLAAGAQAMGWSTTAIPFAINSIPRDGRPACVLCSQCVGHSCPVDAKNGTHNTFIPKALATGRCDLLMNAQVTSILHNGNGHARSVRFVVETEDGPIDREVVASRVVVAAGAFETPRLLLASGLGNDWVGRNHHSHGFAAAIATFAKPGSTSFTGPGHSIATLDFVHDGNAWGGGVLFDAPAGYPLSHAFFGARAASRPFGKTHKEWMRSNSTPLGAISMVQEIPHVDSRIRLDPLIRDRYGMPVARNRPAAHPASFEAADYMTLRAREWVEASGGTEIVSVGGAGAPRGSQHSAGTARLGSDPAHSACDPRGRLWGTSNVYVADAALHTTNGGFNPGLTVMANALRVARLALDE